MGEEKKACENKPYLCGVLQTDDDGNCICEDGYAYVHRWGNRSGWLECLCECHRQKKMWMDDPEMAIDAYRVWLETWIEVAKETENEEEAGELPGLEHALGGFKLFFGAGEENAA